MKTSKEETKKLHKILWSRIEELNKSNKHANKSEIIVEMRNEGLTDLEHVETNCFLCQYAKEQTKGSEPHCKHCLMDWGPGASTCGTVVTDDPEHVIKPGLHRLWYQANESGDYEQAAKYAKQIKELKLKEEK